MKVLLDASVVIAGLYSPTSGSAVILRLIDKGALKGLISQAILDETKRNITNKLPKIIKRYEIFVKKSKVVILSSPTKKDVAGWYPVIDPKDAHVLASGAVSKTDYLVTLDRKHFMLEQVKKSVSFNIVTPKELIEILTEKKELVANLSKKN